MPKTKRILEVFCIVLIFSVLLSAYAYADFKIAIMQDKRGTAAKFRPLLAYLQKNGVKASFVAAKNYSHAAKMFSESKVNGMFSGSGIAGCMIIKEIAHPVVRPVQKEGWSTYWAVVIAPKNSPRFTQDAAYFKGKKVIFCSLASSGEFFFQSIVRRTDVKATIMKASSHGAAIDALARGVADIAIVKNRVWDKSHDKYDNLTHVGEDLGENPNGTLIISKNTDTNLAEKISTILLGLKDDDSIEAKKVKEKLGITGYIKTTIDDFKFTLRLLKKAGVDKSFNFSF